MDFFVLGVCCRFGPERPSQQSSPREPLLLRPSGEPLVNQVEEEEENDRFSTSGVLARTLAGQRLKTTEDHWLG